MLSVTVIRHSRERVSKCSLRSLQGRENLTFLQAKPGFKFDATGYILLEMGARPLSRMDAGRPILVLDSTWRLLPGLQQCLTGRLRRRSIPWHVESAYPRKSKLFYDPMGGLASIEALYLAAELLGESDPTLLDGYEWKEEFLAGLRELRTSTVQHPTWNGSYRT